MAGPFPGVPYSFGALPQSRQIIRADAYAVASKSTPMADRARLQKQIAIRTTMWVGLSKELSAASSLSTAEPRGHVRKPKHIHKAKLTKGALPPTRTALLFRIKEIKQAHAKSKAKLAAH
jgi:hypothetical protein